MIILKILKNRHHSWIGNRIRHNELVVNILEGAISGRKAMGKSGLQSLEEVGTNTGADGYTVIKMALQQFQMKAANQSKDRRII
jgi:hypothetical protein